MSDKPKITATSHLLPFAEFSPAQFERLCLWLVKNEGYVNGEHLGEAGSDQGCDVIAYRITDSGKQLWYFQCKRYQTISATTLFKEIEKYQKRGKLILNEPLIKLYTLLKIVLCG